MTRNTRKGQTVAKPDTPVESVEDRMEDKAVEADNADTMAEAVEAFESGEPDTAATTDTPDESDMDPLEAMKAEIARLRSERDELAAKVAARPVRTRVVKLTEKQLRFLHALFARPDATLSELVAESGAGGVTEPHGFVYRMVDAGYVRLSLPDDTVARFPDIRDGLPKSDSTDAGGEDADTPEAVESDIRGDNGDDGQSAATA